MGTVKLLTGVTAWGCYKKMASHRVNPCFPVSVRADIALTVLIQTTRDRHDVLKVALVVGWYVLQIIIIRTDENVTIYAE